MKNKNNRLICINEYIRINGIDQFLFHLGTSYDNPVMLFLHGGPGSTEALFTGLFQDKWEEIYTVVHWDQRGTGKTLTRNPNELPTIELMLKDLFEVIQYLKKKYNKKKVVLFGHSWGSILGSTFIKKYPEEVEYYIGGSQVISIIENEQVCYKKARELIEQAGDKKSLSKLESIGEYPGSKIVFNKEFLGRFNTVHNLLSKYKVGLKIGMDIYIAALKSPIFKLSDIRAFMKAFKVNAEVYSFLAKFNLRTESKEYKVPVYYILGDKDWQAPYIIAEDYFKYIKAPNKEIFLIPNAGHFLMQDQPDLVFDALSAINKIEGVF